MHSPTNNQANDDVINNVLVPNETSIATTHKQPTQGETPTMIFDLIVERKKTMSHKVLSQLVYVH